MASPASATNAQAGGDGGGLTLTERSLIRAGFSIRAAHEFRDLDHSTAHADLTRRREIGQGIGAIVTAWRVDPPRAEAPNPGSSPTITHRATTAKAQALAIAPPDASPLEIQYLALDLEEGAPTERALANLQARRTTVPAGGVA